MLRSRVVSEGIRTVFPGVIVGTYTPEEAYDMEPVRVVAIPRETDSKANEVPLSEIFDVPDPLCLPESSDIDPHIEAQRPAHHLDSVFEGRDIATISAFLISKKEITEGQTYRDLSPTFSQFIADNQDRFFQAVAKHAATTAD
jgi:hypothetical protein